MDMYQKRKMRAEKKNNGSQENFSKVSISWYPGHMLKTKNDLKSKLKLIDIVVEVLDARIPLSSSNKDLEELFENKSRIIVLNKIDLADDEMTKKWEEYYNNKGFYTMLMNANMALNVDKLLKKINEVGESIYKKKNENKQVEIKPIYRVAIVGIPNVGKSTLINKLAKKETAKASNKPGVTRENKWIRIANNIDLLDTPGLLWPRLDENDSGVKLALTGNIKQEVLDEEELACLGIRYLQNNKRYAKMFSDKYNISIDILQNEPYDILETLGKKRGCLISGGQVDTLRASKIFLEELKNGKIGKITLEEC